jgi:hypothetical protein
VLLKQTHTGRALLAVLVAAFGLAAANAGELTAGPAQVRSGQQVVPILFQADGESVASMQFDIAFDSAAFEIVDVETGEAAAEAVKAPVFAAPENGRTRVVVAGLNQDIIGGGVIAYVVLEPIAADVPAPYVGLDSAVFSNPAGEEIVPEAISDEEDISEEQPAVQRPELAENDRPTMSDNPSDPVDADGPLYSAPVSAGMGLAQWPTLDGTERAANGSSTQSGAATGSQSSRVQIADASDTQQQVYGRRPSSAPFGPGAVPLREQSSPAPVRNNSEPRLTQVDYTFRDSALVSQILGMHVADSVEYDGEPRRGLSVEAGNSSSRATSIPGAELGAAALLSPGGTAVLAGLAVVAVLLSLRRRFLV